MIIFRTLSIVIIALILSLGMFSCNKNEDTDNGSDPNFNSHVNAHFLVNGNYYMNNELVGSMPGISMYVSGQDIYTADLQKCYKNGIPINNIESEDSPSWKRPGLFVKGTDVYVVGSPTYGKFCYWRNGVKTELDCSLSNAYASNLEIFVHNDDVYVFACLNQAGYYYGAIWKNGQYSKIINADNYGINIKSFITDGNDLYATATVNVKVGKFESEGRATYWKNGQQIQLSEELSSATFIYINNKDIYVAGSENGFAKYWKNGVAKTLSDGSRNAVVTRICIKGNDIYALGLNGSRWTLWKNGIFETEFFNIPKDVDAISLQ